MGQVQRGDSPTHCLLSVQPPFCPPWPTSLVATASCEGYALRTIGQHAVKLASIHDGGVVGTIPVQGDGAEAGDLVLDGLNRARGRPQQQADHFRSAVRVSCVKRCATMPLRPQPAVSPRISRDIHKLQGTITFTWAAGYPVAVTGKLDYPVYLRPASAPAQR